MRRTVMTTFLVVSMAGMFFGCGVDSGGEKGKGGSALMDDRGEEAESSFKAKDKALWHHPDDELYLVEIKALTSSQAFVRLDEMEFWTPFDRLDKILSESGGFKAGDRARWENLSKESYLVTVQYVTKAHAYIKLDDYFYWVLLDTLERVIDI